MPALTSFLPTRGFMGFGVEAIHGTPVAASVYAPVLDESFELNPGIIMDHLIRASKDVAYNPAIGEQKIDGKIDTLIWIDASLALLGAAIGTDAWQTGGATTGNGTIGSAVAVGATSVSLSAQTTTPLVANDYIELRQGTGPASATNISEILQVASVTGAGPYVVTFTTPQVTVNAYTTAGLVYRIAAGSPSFQHALYPDVPNANTWKTFSVEKNFGGLGSQQFAGATVSKANFKFDTKGTARASYDFITTAQASITPTTPAFANSTPLALNNYAISLFGASDTSVASFEIDIDNMGKELWTFNGGNLPSITLPTGRKTTGKWTNVAQDLTYYNSLGAGTVGAAVFTITQGTQSIVFTLPEIVMTKGSLPLKIGDAMLYTVDFSSVFNSTAANSIKAIVTSTSLYRPLL